MSEVNFILFTLSAVWYILLNSSPCLLNVWCILLFSLSAVWYILLISFSLFIQCLVCMYCWFFLLISFLSSQLFGCCWILCCQVFRFCCWSLLYNCLVLSVDFFSLSTVMWWLVILFFVFQMAVLEGGVKGIKDSLNTSPQLSSLPKDVAALQGSVATFGSTLQACCISKFALLVVVPLGCWGNLDLPEILLSSYFIFHQCISLQASVYLLTFSRLKLAIAGNVE